MYIHTIHTYLHKHIYIYIYTHIFILLPNVNDKNDYSNSNEHNRSYCFKEILLVVCKFYMICIKM